MRILCNNNHSLLYVMHRACTYTNVHVPVGVIINGRASLYMTIINVLYYECVPRVDLHVAAYNNICRN